MMSWESVPSTFIAPGYMIFPEAMISEYPFFVRRYSRTGDPGPFSGSRWHLARSAMIPA